MNESQQTETVVKKEKKFTEKLLIPVTGILIFLFLK